MLHSQLLLVGRTRFIQGSSYYTRMGVIYPSFIGSSTMARNGLSRATLTSSSDIGSSGREKSLEAKNRLLPIGSLPFSTDRVQTEISHSAGANALT